MNKAVDIQSTAEYMLQSPLTVHCQCLLTETSYHISNKINLTTLLFTAAAAAVAEIPVAEVS
jgi:hypothetical protein